MEIGRNLYPFSGSIRYYIFKQQINSPPKTDALKEIWNLKDLEFQSAIPSLLMSGAANVIERYSYNFYSNIVYTMGIVSPPLQIDHLMGKIKKLTKSITYLEEKILHYDEFLKEHIPTVENYEEVKFRKEQSAALLIRLIEQKQQSIEKLTKEKRREKTYTLTRNIKLELLTDFSLKWITRVTSDLIFFPLDKISVWTICQTENKASFLQTAKKFFTAKGIHWYTGYAPQLIFTTLKSVVAPLFFRFFRSLLKVPSDAEVMNNLYDILPDSFGFHLLDQDEVLDAMDSSKSIIIPLFRSHAKNAFVTVLFDWAFGLFFYPLITLANKMMVQGSSDAYPFIYANLFDAVQTIYSRNGLKDFYSGFKVYSFTVIPQLITIGVLYIAISIFLEQFLRDPETDKAIKDEIENLNNTSQ